MRVAVEGPDAGFAINAYVGRIDFREVLENLRRFAKQIYGGLCEVRFGEFGPEYANGAVHPTMAGEVTVSDRSAIEWTDATWNPVTGCTKVSPGCAHCYAETSPSGSEASLATPTSKASTCGSGLNDWRDPAALGQAPSSLRELDERHVSRGHPRRIRSARV